MMTKPKIGFFYGLSGRALVVPFKLVLSLQQNHAPIRQLWRFFCKVFFPKKGAGGGQLKVSPNVRPPLSGEKQGGGSGVQG